MLRPVRKMKREGGKNKDETIFWNKARGKGRGEIANGTGIRQREGAQYKSQDNNLNLDIISFEYCHLSAV